MPDKQEMLSKFATQTGAEVPGVQEAPSNDHTSHNAEPSDPPDAAASVSQSEELFKDSFSDRTQVKPWQNPKYKGPLVLVIVLPFSLLIAWVFKGGIPKPSLVAKTPTPPALPSSSDDTAKPAKDGEWAAFASTNGMRQQFNGAADKEQTDGAKKFQSQLKATQAQEAAGSATSSGSPGETSPSTRAAIEDSGTPMDSSGAPATSPYRPPMRSYTPPEPVVQYTPPRTQAYTSRSPKQVTRVASVTTPKQTVSQSKPASVKASKSQRPTEAKQEERSPKERIAAMLAATSTSVNGSGAGSFSSMGRKQVATVPSMPTQPATQFTPGVSPVTSAIGGVAPTYASPAQSGTLRPAYTAEPVAYLPSEAAVIQGQPQTLINRSQSAKAKLLTSIAFVSGDYGSLAGQPVEVELTERLGDLPVGTRIVAVVAATQNNRSGHDNKAEVVRLQPTAITVGDVEMPLPEGVIGLSGKDGAPLLAKRGGSDFLRILGGLAGTASGGAGLTNFGASQNVEFGNSSYFQSVGANVAIGVLSNAAQQLQQSGAGGNVLILKAGSSITVSVLKPLTLPWTSVAVPQSMFGFQDLTDPELLSMVRQTQESLQGGVNAADH